MDNKCAIDLILMNYPEGDQHSELRHALDIAITAMHKCTRCVECGEIFQPSEYIYYTKNGLAHENCS